MPPHTAASRPYDILDDAPLAHTFANADRILDETGIELRGDGTARDLLREAGARVEGERVRFPPGLARQIIAASTPRRFTQRARNPERSVIFGAGMPVFAPAYGAPFIRDEGGERRYSGKADFLRLAKLAQAAAEIDHAGGMYCEISDSPSLVRHLDMLDTLIRATDKPFMGCIRNPGQVRDSLDAAALVFGAETFARDCCLLNLFNVESPLVVAGPILEGVRMTAAAGQASLICSYSMMGMTTPVTLAGGLAVMLAEVQALAALTQLVRPGAPVICGIFAVPFSMTAMRPVFGTVESHLAMLAGAQLVRALGLPFRGDGGVSSAKTADAQAAYESAGSLHAAVTAGSDFVLHAAGWLEDGLSICPEKYANDLHTIAHLKAERAALAQGLDAPAALPGVERQTPEALLARYEEPPLPMATAEALADFVKDRKRRAMEA